MRVDAARFAQNVVEVELMNNAKQALIRDFTFGDLRRKRLPQRAWRQIGFLGEKEDAVAAGTNYATLAGAPETCRRPEKCNSRRRLGPRHEHATANWDRYRQVI